MLLYDMECDWKCLTGNVSTVLSIMTDAEVFLDSYGLNNRIFTSSQVAWHVDQAMDTSYFVLCTW